MLGNHRRSLRRNRRSLTSSLNNGSEPKAIRTWGARMDGSSVLRRGPRASVGSDMGHGMQVWNAWQMRRHSPPLVRARHTAHTGAVVATTRTLHTQLHHQQKDESRPRAARCSLALLLSLPPPPPWSEQHPRRTLTLAKCFKCTWPRVWSCRRLPHIVEAPQKGAPPGKLADHVPAHATPPLHLHPTLLSLLLTPPPPLRRRTSWRCQLARGGAGPQSTSLASCGS